MCGAVRHPAGRPFSTANISYVKVDIYLNDKLAKTLEFEVR